MPSPLPRVARPSSAWAGLLCGERTFTARCKTMTGEPEHGTVTQRYSCRENRSMTGIQFVTDEKGRRTAVLIDLKKHRAIWEDFWDGLVSESRRKEKGIPYEEYRAKRLKHNGRRG